MEGVGWGIRGGLEEEPLSPDPLECFAAALLLATEEHSVELIVVNATCQQRGSFQSSRNSLCYLTGSQLPPTFQDINLRKINCSNNDEDEDDSTRVVSEAM